MMSLGGRARPEIGFSRPRAGEPRDGACFACARRCGDPAACLSLGPGGNFFRLALCWDRILQEHKTGSAEVHAGRGGRAGVRACGCVHERGPGATHTHTHTLTRPHPRGALGRAARACPDLHLQGRSLRSCARCPAPADSGNRTG